MPDKKKEAAKAPTKPDAFVPPDSRPADAIAAEKAAPELDAGEVELLSNVDMADGEDKKGVPKFRRIPAGVVKKSELGKEFDDLKARGAVRERESKKK